LIRIFEISPPKKLSGLSSLIIDFDYNPYIVDSLKTLPTAHYHKKEKAWEVPICYLGRILDNLTFLDEIQLKLLDTPEFGEFHFNKQFNLEPLSEIEKVSFKMKPFEHQLEAINFGLDKEKWLLLDSMGLGKTNSIIWLAETLKRRGIIDHCFIICGVNSLKQNWKKEIQKFSTESAVVLGEYTTRNGTTRYRSMDKRAQQLKDPIEEFFVITNLESLRDDRIIEAFKTSTNKFGMIAFDEAHKAATKSSQQGTNLLKLEAPFKIAATGTLITNNPLSAYVPLSWTGNDESTLTNYKSQYCNFGGFKNNQVIGFKNLDVLQEVIQACSLRRTLDQVRSDMPPKTVTLEVLEPDDDQRKFYEAIKEGVKEEADKVELKTSSLLALTTRLRQASACPSILTTQPVSSCKVDRCVELIQELTSQGEKVVVLSVFKETLNELAAKLGEFRFSVNTGDVPDPVVANNVDRFQNDPTEQVFIGTWGKVGTGWTLNSASYLICLDTPYTAAMFDQGTDRIWRVNNTRPAFITVLMCKDTIDERVQQIIETKKELGEYLVDGVEFNNTNNSKLDDELRAILRDL
jgi:SWI/SNF-related matrix-associated actin-dependent regulator 1 of chromatin subfamily A